MMFLTEKGPVLSQSLCNLQECRGTHRSLFCDNQDTGISSPFNMKSCDEQSFCRIYYIIPHSSLLRRKAPCSTPHLPATKERHYSMPEQVPPTAARPPLNAQETKLKVRCKTQSNPYNVCETKVTRSNKKCLVVTILGKQSSSWICWGGICQF